jgi:uncharacterized protein (DUF58 family)
MSDPLTPIPIEAPAQGRGLLPAGFGARFFLILAIGFIWLIPAWWSPRLIAVMFVWDLCGLAIWVVDLLKLPKPSELTVSRSFSGPLVLGRPASITVCIRNRSGRSVFAHILDETSTVLRDEPPVFEGVTAHTYEATPRERGNIHFGGVFVRYRSELGFAERRCVAPLAQTIVVYPDLVQARDHALHLVHSRQQQIEKRQHRYRGLGREFESLREYRDGDELRDVSWTATARRRQLVTRTYNVERSQTVWMVVDAGRLMRGQIRSGALPLTKLDYAVNAALSVGQVALQYGDRVGLLVYGRSIQASIAPARGPQQLRAFVDALARVRSEPVEADHARAANMLLHKQTRRSLMIWITDFAETPAVPEVIEYASHAGRRHLVLFAAISQPDLFEVAHSIPESETAMFRQAAALEIVDRRELLLRNLRHTGVLAIDLDPNGFTTAVVNQYLEIKDRGLL